MSELPDTPRSPGRESPLPVEDDSEPAPSAAPGTAVMPLTKDAIEKFLNCQLDTHLNDATPREERSRERSREPREEEAWQQPPTLLHHDSNKRSQNKGGRSEREQGAPHLNTNPQNYGAQRPEVPGAVDLQEDDETRAKLEKQRLELLEKKLAEQEKQTKMLYDRLGRSNTFSGPPPAGANGHGPTAQATGAGHRRAPALANRRASEGTNRKDRFEQLLMESAARAKEKTQQKKTHAQDGQADDEPALHRQSSQSVSKRGPRSARSARSHDNISHEGDAVADEGYSKAAAVDSIEQPPADKEDGEKKRGKSKKDLISVQEQTEKALGRTESGTEIDLETGLPEGTKQAQFSWFYAVCFVVLVAILIYASVIILQRYT